MAIHLELQLDCHARRAGLAKPFVFISRLAATKSSSWIATFGGASLAMTNKGPRRQVSAHRAPHPPREGKRSSRPGNGSRDPLPVPEAKGQ